MPMSRPLTRTILSRDVKTLLQRRTYWLALAVWALVCGVLYFSLLADFIAIQPQLRAKNLSYGVTDMAIIPYIKLTATLAVVLVVSLCSRLFYYEHFDAYARLFKSTQPDAKSLVLAKVCYIAIISVTLTVITAIIPLTSLYFFTFSIARVTLMLAAYFVLLCTVGLLAAVISQCFRHSIGVVLTVFALLLVSELAVRLLVDPAWLAPIALYFSPLAHIERMATGIVASSDILFFTSLWLILLAMAIRQFNNTYLSTS